MNISMTSGIDLRNLTTLIVLLALIPNVLHASEDEPAVLNKATSAADSQSTYSVTEQAMSDTQISVPPSNIATVTETIDEVEQSQASDTTLEHLTHQDDNSQQPLLLLGSSVEPGEAALLKWSLKATFIDNSTPVPVLVVNGVKKGPTLCLTAAVHGDELNGIEIVRRIVHEVNPEKLSGSVIGVPIVNMQGFRRESRYLPDRRDLNRSFPGRENGSHASRTAHSFFTNVIQHCDYLVDIHTGSLSRTNLPQIRANLLIPEIASFAEKMGSIVVLQSKGALGTLRRAAMDAGIAVVTLEAGAPNNLQKEAVEEGVASILSAMSSLKLIPKKFWRRNKEPVFYQSTWIRAHQGGILFSKVELGDSVEKGETLGLLSDPITNKTSEIIAPLDGRVIGMALNQVMYPGFAAYHIGLKSSAVEAAQPQQLIPNVDSETEIISIKTKEGTEAELPESNTPVDEVSPSIPETQKQPIEEMELPTIENE